MLSFRVRIALTILSLASFLGTSSILRGSLAAPEEFEGNEKLAFLSEHLDEYTALIIGSSAVFRGLSPAVLDPIVQTVEPAFRSFNLAARGMYAFETDTLLRKAVETSGQQLRWVIIEPAEWVAQVPIVALETERTRDWHDTRQSLRALRSARSLPKALRTEWTLFHLRQYLLRLSNYGDGPRLWASLTSAPRERYVDDETIAKGQGYVSIEESLGKYWEKRRAKFLEGVDAYMESVEKLRAPRSKPAFGQTFQLATDQREWLEARGLRVLHVMPPFVVGRNYILLPEAKLAFPVLINFLSPDLHPELYAVENRMDEQHLTENGAMLMSRTAGQRIAEFLARDQGSSTEGTRTP